MDLKAAMESNKGDINQRFRYLLTKYKDKQCSLEEMKELFEYLGEDHYRAILESEMLEDYKSLVPSASVHKVDWDSVYENIISPQKHQSRPLFPFWLSVAALFLVVISAGIYLWNSGFSPVRNTGEHTIVKRDIAPGSNKAILKLGDGTQIVLDQAQNGFLASSGSTKIRKASSGQVVYESGNSDETGDVQMNTITIPRGGQFMVILPDNSKVWLNAESSLSYPTAFKGRSRHVELTGEAYFEVAGDRNHPFYVKSGRAVVEVLGTHFNVMAYQDASYASVTLAEGSVRVNAGTGNILLRPGQQAAFAHENGPVTLHDVDPDEVTDWKNGYFQFDNTPVNEVMNKIRRWYNVDIEYRGKKPDVLFTGMISRNNNVSKVLTLLEKSGGVQFEIADNKIIVKND
ncbi:hypothetical protein DDR33_14330 [Pararcticibacter amylolyticus]|uniref:Anti-sigma factor n=2 Tax=Pararcticibacter amylolyticus TaxID=2173175 RepID=A0A2U2PF00_9SPHI|nr:hypothetical protein DDR33_14330 [Pararcticibacter amylolyticus]